QNRRHENRQQGSRGVAEDLRTHLAEAIAQHHARGQALLVAFADWIQLPNLASVCAIAVERSTQSLLHIARARNGACACTPAYALGGTRRYVAEILDDFRLGYHVAVL